MNTTSTNALVANSTSKGREPLLFIKSTLVGFILTLVVNTISAVVITGPLLNEDFGIYIRTQEQGLNFPALLLGYLVLGGVMAYLYPKVRLEGHWIRKGLVVGLSIGFVTSFGGHMLTAGWSMLPAQPMAISGLIDTFANAVGGIGIAYLHRQR